MTSGDWTPEAAAAIRLCKRWADRVTAEMPCDIYLFGSAIYQSGEQFDAQQSDLDLVLLFHDTPDATARVERLVQLRSLKAQLELEMVPTLHRTNCQEPGVSVVPLSIVELQANIHKSGARRFFDRNIYLSLATELESVGLPNAGTMSIADEARQALEYVQNVRNRFLAVGANGTGGIAPFDGVDPLPKSLARVAAQLTPDPDVGAWYDTRFGLEYLCEELSRRRSESEAIGHLYRKISIRRGGRGKKRPLSDKDQLLLAEILHDRAASADLERLATWEIRFVGVPPGMTERERLLRNLQTLVPDAQIMGIFEGSIIVRLRSSERGLFAVLRLEMLGALPGFFGVDKVDVATIEGFHEWGFKARGVIGRVAEHIAAWRPQSHDNMASMEEDLAQWLAGLLKEDETLSGAHLAREALIIAGERPLRADVLIQFRELGHTQDLVIELVRLRSRASFFQQIERARRIALPTILVIVGTSERLAGLGADIRKLSATDGRIRVVPVQLDDG